MIFRIQAQQLISGNANLAESRLKSHQAKGSDSKLSIFEVAKLMDQVLFDPKSTEQKEELYFDICYN